MHRKILSIILIITYLSALLTITTAQGDKQNVNIVVTFPYLLEDVKKIACENDNVKTLVPSGIDPHEYQLTPKDIEILSNADLVVSTAHTPFEIKIRELIETKTLKVKLIEVPDIDGVKFLEHPYTNEVNYHGLLMNFDNYVLFIKNLSSTLSSIRPDCSEIYENKAKNQINKVLNLSIQRPLDKHIAIIDSPTIHYLVTSLGAEVKHIIEVEHEVPITPESISRAEEIVKSFRNKTILIVVQGSKIESILHDLAQRYKVPIIVIPSLLTYNSTLDYVEHSVNIVLKNMQTTLTITSAELSKDMNYLIYIVIGVAVIISIFVVFLLATKK